MPPAARELQLPTRLPLLAGPLSNLAYAIQHYPAVVDKIQHVWWMGGALKVHGNVYEPHTDGSAEWNAYWDPAAMGVVWGSSVPLTLVPLDGTNKVTAA
jgi:purine nucleosidase